MCVCNKPVMLNNDGTEAYELDPNDHTKKKDNTASDVANSSFAGNAMSRIPKVYLKMWEADGYEYCNICDVKLDDNYHAYAHTRADGSEMDYLYLSILCVVVWIKLICLCTVIVQHNRLVVFDKPKISKRAHWLKSYIRPVQLPQAERMAGSLTGYPEARLLLTGLQT